VAPGGAWPAVAGFAVLVVGMNALLTRASARGDILLGFVAVDRWGARAMGPPSYLVCSHGVTGLLAAVITLGVAPGSLGASARPAQAAALLAHGLLGVTGTGMQTTALTSAPAASVNAIRRISALIAVVLGTPLFREPDLPRRLAAPGLACAGAACLLFAH
jgi:hypothetical protein